MSTHIISRVTPGLLSPWSMCRNGQVVPAALGLRALRGYGFIAAHQKKVALSASLNIQSIPTSLSGTNTRWRYRLRTGHGTTRIAHLVCLAMDDNTTGTDPRIQWQVQEDGGGYSASDQIHYGIASAAPSDTPDEFFWGIVRVDVSPGAVVDGYMETIDYARPVACAVWEENEGSVVDDSLTGIPNTSAITMGKPIDDVQHADLYTDGTNLWKHNAGILAFWSADQLANAAVMSFSSMTNVMDAASTTVTANTPGFHLDTAYKRTVGSTDVPVELAVYAERTAGAETCQVQVTDGTSTITTGAITTAGWYTATGNITAADGDKWDLQATSTNGLTTAVRVWAMSLGQWES